LNNYNLHLHLSVDRVFCCLRLTSSGWLRTSVSWSWKLSKTNKDFSSLLFC